MDGLSAVEPAAENHPAPISCPACAHQKLSPLLEVDAVPVYCNRLWPSRQEALAAPRGDLRLVACLRCGHIGNAAFDPAALDYQGSYENSLHFSPHFQQYALDLARYLVDKYGLRGRRILEIGCGKGDFLRLLTRLGKNRGIGFDPSWQPGRGEEENLQFIAGLFSPQQAVGIQADFVCCRQVLEHLEDPVGFLTCLRVALEGRGVPVFFEVPNAAHTFQAAGIWDLIYEHPSYFTRQSLAAAFHRAGFQVVGLQEAFAGQYLWIEALAVGAAGENPSAITDQPDLEDFAARFAAQLGGWRDRLRDLDGRQKRAVIWGAGSKGVTFANLVASPAITQAVDLNPHKQGMYLPGTGQQVIAPEALVAQAPDLILVMNPVYRQEIGRHLEQLGLTIPLETV